MRPSELYRKLRPFLRVAHFYYVWDSLPRMVTSHSGLGRLGLVWEPGGPDPGGIISGGRFRKGDRPTFAQFCAAYGLTPDTVPDEGIVETA